MAPAPRLSLALVCAAITSFFSCSRATPMPSQAVVAEQQTHESAIDGLIDSYVHERGFAGVVFAEFHDRPVLFKAYGLANREEGVDNTNETRFPIASISKTFVAAAVLRLVADGKISLDAPIGKYLPSLPKRIGEPVTVKMLLAHTSGLPREMPMEPTETLDLKTQVSRIAALPLGQKPGLKFGYSNAGYVLLGAIVQATCGRSYEAYLANEIFGRAKLTDTGQILGTSPVDHLAVGYGLGRTGLTRPPRARHLGIYPAGGLYSTAGDLARWAHALDDGSVLPPELSREMFRAQVREGDSPGDSTGYGWSLRSDASGRVFRIIAGSGDGGKTILLREPTLGLTVVVLSNIGETPIVDISKGIVALLMDRPVKKPQACRVADASAFRDLEGDYDFSGTGLDVQMAKRDMRVALIEQDGRFFLWEASDNSAELLCEKDKETLVLSYTNEIAITFERPEAFDPEAEKVHDAKSTTPQPTMVFTWDDKAYRAPRAPFNNAPRKAPPKKRAH